MARTIRNARLENRTQRLKLERERIHWHSVSEGVALGYRRAREGFGTWYLRVLADRAEGRYETKRIGRADDHEDADGREIFTYFDAAQRARELVSKARDKARGGASAPLTVSQAVADYLEWFKLHRKSHAQTENTLTAHVLPRFGRELVADLSPRDISKWHEKLATTPARARSARGAKAQCHQAQDLKDPNVARARKASANRILTVFRAALNHAWRAGHVASDNAWRRVKPFHNVGEPRVRYLERAEAVRLINASAGDLHNLVCAALYSGCRLGELTALCVEDYHADSATVHVRDSKSGRPRHINLNAEGEAFFAAITAGRPGAEVMLLKADGSPWGLNHHVKPLLAGCAAAKIEPAISFHILRHTYASWLVMSGAELQVVSESLGHADMRITQRHYGHLAPSYVARVIRDRLPALGIDAPTNVIRLNPQPAPATAPQPGAHHEPRRKPHRATKPVES